MTIHLRKILAASVGIGVVVSDTCASVGAPTATVLRARLGGGGRVGRVSFFGGYEGKVVSV